jgi:hypothetical protein
VEQERDHRAQIVAGSEPTDQLLARRPGFGEGQVDEAHVYVDDMISGAEFGRRGGLGRLMNALKPRAPFDMLIMMDDERLGREQIERPTSSSRSSPRASASSTISMIGSAGWRPPRTSY